MREQDREKVSDDSSTADQTRKTMILNEFQ